MERKTEHTVTNEKHKKLCADMFALTDGHDLKDWLTAATLTAAWVCVDSGVSKELFSRIFSESYDLAVARKEKAAEAASESEGGSEDAKK